jgi:hypothetical protein
MLPEQPASMSPAATMADENRSMEPAMKYSPA